MLLFISGWSHQLTPTGLISSLGEIVMFLFGTIVAMVNPNRTYSNQIWVLFNNELMSKGSFSSLSTGWKLKAKSVFMEDPLAELQPLI